MSTNEIIGIGGADGKLGRRFSWQFAPFGKHLCHDLAKPAPEDERIGIDPAFRGSPELATNEIWVGSINELMRASTRVIWCARLKDLSGLEELRGSLDLQSSTMALSHRKKAELQASGEFEGPINVVHPAMNKHGRVYISSKSDDIQGTKTLIEAIGLHPKVIAPRDHDRIMARTTGEAALMCTDDLKELRKLAEAGDLAPSGSDFVIPLAENREANWTQATLDDIFGNPELLAIAEDWVKLLKEHQAK